MSDNDDFINQEAFQQLAEKVQDVYRTLGLTVVGQQTQIQPDGDIILITAALVRKTAYKQVTRDLDTARTLNQMAADDAEARLNQRAEQIARAVAEGRVLDVLTGKDQLVRCEHTRIHEGLCLDCQEEVKSDT
jgi:hypothetical protein